MTNTNIIGQTAPGITVLNANGTFSGVSATASGQTLRGVAANSFAFSQTCPFSGSSGCVQQVIYPLGNTQTTLTVTGTQASVYNAAAQLASFTFTPKYSDSTIFIIGNCSVNFAPPASPSNFAYINTYLNSTGSPIIATFMGLTVGSTGYLGSSGGGTQLTNLSGTQTFNVCGFRQLANTSVMANFNNNSYTIREMANPVTHPISPIQYTATSSAAVLVGSFPVPSNSSLSLNVYWAAFNTVTQLGTNGGSIIAAGVNVGGVLSLSNSTLVSFQILPALVAPYMYIIANNATTAMEFYAVGATGSNYDFNIYFELN